MNWMDNRYVQKAFFFIALYNLFKSYMYVRREENEFKSVINENDDFYKALATYGFIPRKLNFGYSTTYKINDKLKLDEIKAILDTQIIKTIKHFTESEMLLGVVSTKVEMGRYNTVRVTIQPKTQPVMVIDLIDSIISISIWLMVWLLIYFFHY